MAQIVVMQLLAYYMAIELGLDADKPRNLAKSVTVNRLFNAEVASDVSQLPKYYIICDKERGTPPSKL